MNTKNMSHRRQSNKKAGATVTVAANTIITMKKDQFLANLKNKHCHAIGCDTSCLYGIGKGASLTKFRASIQFVP